MADKTADLAGPGILNERGELTVEATGEFSLPLGWQRHPHPGAGPAGGQPS